MKVEREIYMDFKRAKEAANELDNFAADLLRLSECNVSSIMENLSSHWSCPAASDFRSKEERIQGGIQQMVTAARNLAEQIRRDARSIYYAEMRAYEIASKRDS